MLRFLTLILFIFTSSLYAQQLYKCVDAQGNHYASETPCHSTAVYTPSPEGCCKKTHGKKPGFDYQAVINGSCSGQGVFVQEAQCSQLQGNAILHFQH